LMLSRKGGKRKRSLENLREEGVDDLDVGLTTPGSQVLKGRGREIQA